VSRETLAEGYRQCTKASEALEEEMAGVSRESSRYLGDAPDWWLMNVRRGDIVIVELDPTEGSERRGTRPRLVVQNDVGDENAPTTIVVPFTTARGDQLYPSKSSSRLTGAR